MDRWEAITHSHLHERKGGERKREEAYNNFELRREKRRGEEKSVTWSEKSVRVEREEEEEEKDDERK